MVELRNVQMGKSARPLDYTGWKGLPGTNTLAYWTHS